MINTASNQPKRHRKLSYDKVSQAHNNDKGINIEFKKINVEDLNKAGIFKESAYIIHEVHSITTSRQQNNQHLRNSSEMTFDDD